MATKPQAAYDRIAAANGNAYDATNNPDGLAQGGHRQNFVPDLQAGVLVANYVSDLAIEVDTDAAAALASRNQASTFADNASTSAGNAATSATASAGSAAALIANSTNSQAISTGSKTFTVQTGRQLGAGQRVTITNDAAPTTRIMYGQVTSYSGTSLVVAVDEVVGSGTYAAWTIRLGGTKGTTGSVGPESWATPVAWASGVAYSSTPPRSAVTYLGETYVCIQAHTSSGTILPTDAAYWIKIAAKGAELTKATGAQLRALTDDVNYLTAKTNADAMAFVNSAPSNLALGFNFNYALSGNVTIASPANSKEGLTGTIRFVQDSTGGRTATWNTFWNFGADGVPTLSTAANAVDYVFYTILPGATSAICSFKAGQ